MNLIPTATLESFLCWLLLLFVIFYFIGCFSFHGFVYHPSLFCEPSPGLHLRILYFLDNTFLSDLQHFHFIFSLLNRSFVSFLPDFLVVVAAIALQVLQIWESVSTFRCLTLPSFSPYLARSTFIKASLEVDSSASKVAENSCYGPKDNPNSITRLGHLAILQKSFSR